MIQIVKHHDGEKHAKNHLIHAAHKRLIHYSGNANEISKQDITQKRNNCIDSN